MEYHLKTKKKDVKSFKLEGSTLYYLSREGLFFNDSLVAKGIDQTNYSFYNGVMVFLKGEITHIGEKKVDKSILVDSLYDYTAIFSSNFNLDDFTLQYEVLDIKDFSLVYDFGHLPMMKSFLRKGDRFYLHFEEELVCTSILNKKFDWKLNKRVLKIIGEYQNQLLVACSDHLLLTVDVNTGEILHQWQELSGFEVGSFYKDILPNPANFVLDKLAAKLIGVFDTYYFEIDLGSKEINYFQLKDELSNYGISDFRAFSNNPFTPEHIFLTAHTYLDDFPNVDLSSVLALNRKTQKVDWIHTFKDTGLGTNVPQITSTHLYQLDTEKNLYVFERID